MKRFELAKRMCSLIMAMIFMCTMMSGCGKVASIEEDHMLDGPGSEMEKPVDTSTETDTSVEATKPKEPETKIVLVEKTDIQKYWNGDWYGYMRIADATGAYEGNKTTSWDACAVIDLDENGDGTITIWYAAGDGKGNGNSYASPIAFGDINVDMLNGEGEHGTGISRSAWVFADNENGKVEEYGWIMDPSYDPNFPDMMYFGSQYKDDNGTMDVEFILRPWGNPWSEITEHLDYVMHSFYNWYEPTIQAGKAMPMDFLSESDKTIEERKAELTAPVEKEITVTEDTPATDDTTEVGTDDAKASATPSESYDGVTPKGDMYTWGNITACIPAGMTTTNGGIGDPTNENSLWIQNGMKYFLVSLRTVEEAQNDVANTKSFNNAEDASFAINGTVWTAALYEYSGSPVWQAYATINGTTYEIMSYGYAFGAEETLTVLSSLK